ncbi:MAG TPA: alginate lyase family protein [Gammaproteobacteria bacterium]|jgi:hypothetical protein|nr:alginate lyase family protein [Gammaproteobacteria bacterium]
MKFENLMRADLADIANRGWQEMWRTFDRVAVEKEGVRSLGVFDHLAPRPLPAWSQDSAQRASVQSGQFFAGPAESDLADFFAARLPGTRERSLAAGEALCQRSFSLLGHRALFLSEPLDWHRDAVSGCRAPLVHWSRINPLDPDKVGDSKVTWELNRHQWLVHLAQAWRLSGEERYAVLFAESVRHWMQANPPGMGINWASSMEISYRLISWCWALELFRGAPPLTPGLHAEMLGWLRAHASHVEKYLSHYFSPNTHLTGEALGLFYAGTLFPELPRAARWRRLGQNILLEQLTRQVHADGVYFEQSTCYQRYTIEIYLHFLILARRNGIEVPAWALERVQKMLDSLLAFCRPDGSMPQMGDTDGGRLLPLAQRGADDCRDVLSLAAAFFGRADYAWAARGITPEVAWLLGRAGWEAFDALEPVPPATPPSRLFPEGGQAVLQSGWEHDAHQLLLDVGPLGCRVTSGHGHADLLAIQCSAYGKAQLVDPGTYCYTGNAHWRDHFRSSAAHNTVTVDHKSQAVPVGPFAWRSRPAAKLRNWITTPGFDYVDAEHDAYRRLSDPVRHRRRVLFVKPHYWVVVDDLEGAEVHTVDLQFQFAPMPLVLGGDGWARSGRTSDPGLFLRAFSTAPLQAAVHEGEVEPIRGWVSPDYGLRAPAPQLVYSTSAQLPLRIVTLLVPHAPGETRRPEVTAVQSGGSTKLIFGGGREIVRVNGQQVTVERADGTGITPLGHAETH